MSEKGCLIFLLDGVPLGLVLVVGESNSSLLNLLGLVVFSLPDSLLFGSSVSVSSLVF